MNWIKTVPAPVPPVNTTEAIHNAFPRTLVLWAMCSIQMADVHKSVLRDSTTMAREPASKWGFVRMGIRMEAMAFA